ncbi:MAG: hypothetical protein JXR36_16035 [Bacteroidales bacterium]|nr:hypothetical protein [Bacteroidales bacterium]
MDKSFFVFFISFAIFLNGCNNNDDSSLDDDSKEGVVDIINPKVDVISGYYRDDLLVVFKKEVLFPIDSAFNNCISTILQNNIDVDYSQKLVVVTSTNDFITAKIDRFEKFGVYEMDETCKTKMLDVLSIYQKALSNEAQELLFIVGSTGVMSKNEQKIIDSINGIIIEKMLIKEEIVHEIMNEYNHQHNKT